MISPLSKWVGVLGQKGILLTQEDETAVTTAMEIVGEQGLSSLRQWLREQPPSIVERERRAAVEVCVFMAHADRAVDHAERALLREIIVGGSFDEETEAQLLATIDDPPSLEGIEERLTHPILRELMLALSWDLAAKDGAMMLLERDYYVGLATRLNVERARMDAICDRLAELNAG